MYKDELITKSDLEELKKELKESIKNALKNKPTEKIWLKSNEAQKMLGISSSGLRNLRTNGTLPYSKLGGTIYFEHADIIEILEKNKVSGYYIA